MAYRVLVVDDSADFRLLASVALSRSGRFEVCGEAADGASAVSLAAALRVDAVVLDLNMPGTSGWWAIAELRRRVPWAAIIVYSAFVPAGDATELTELGADTVLSKTYRPSALVEAIEEVLCARIA